MVESMDSPIDRNRRLLNLALDCRLIYPRKKEKIETLLAERLKEDDTADVMDLLTAENVLNPEKAAYLLALDAHTAACARDAYFGTLAVANQMAAQKEVDTALAFQKETFRKTRESLRLGEILKDRGILSPADCTALLLTQNRIRNEDLLDALDHLGRTPEESETINRRFGAIALKKGLVTMEQVGRALNLQKNERLRTGTSRFLGAILREEAGLSTEDVAAVLEEQKRMEVRRLNLPGALYTVKEELRVFRRLSRVYAYTVSADGIEAWARKLTVPEEPVTVYELLIWLRKAGITFGILNDAALVAFIETAEPDQPVLVARGQEPEPSRDQGVRFYFEDRDTTVPPQTPPETEVSPNPETDPEAQTDQKASQDDQAPAENEKSRPAPGPVIQGDLLAQILPGQEGKPGKNVMGHPVHPARPKTRTLYAGTGVVRKGSNFFAKAEGYPRLKNGTTLVVEAPAESQTSLTLTGDIPEDTRDRYLGTDLTVRGSLLTEGILNCRSLILKGDLLGEAGCGGDMTVGGNLGKDDAPMAHILCHGSVRIARGVSNAHVLCAGTFTAVNAAAAGADICAGRGLTVGEAVAGPDGPSVLRAGLLPRDPLLSLDQTLDIKTAELAALKKEGDMAALTQEYRRDLETAEQHQLEQDIFYYLAQIIEGPELYQYPELQDKLDYLKALPEHSSVRSYYLKIPDSDAASTIVAQFLPPACRDALEETLRQIKARLVDPEPERTEDENPMPETERIETAYRARLEALENEVAENSAAIAQAQRELASLTAARQRLGSTYVKAMAPGDFPVIRVKNKCEKGTVIQGILARHVLDKTVYNVRFRESVDPGTLKAAIVIEN